MPRITRKREELLGTDSSTPLLVLRAPWLEAYFVLHLSLFMFGLLFPLGVYLGLFGVTWLGAVFVVALIGDAISYSCQARTLTVYENEILFRDGIAGQNPRRIPISQISDIRIRRASETGYRFGLEAIEIVSQATTDRPIRLRRIRNAEQAKRLIERVSS